LSGAVEPNDDVRHLNLGGVRHGLRVELGEDGGLTDAIDRRRIIYTVSITPIEFVIMDSVSQNDGRTAKATLYRNACWCLSRSLFVHKRVKVRWVLGAVEIKSFYQQRQSVCRLRF